MAIKERFGTRKSPGFSMVEVLFALLVAAVLVGLALPGLMRSVAESRVENAAAVVANDLELAFALARRQGTPVRITFDPDARTYRFMPRGSTALLHSRGLGANSEFSLGSVSFSTTEVDVFPQGLASAPLTVTLTAGPHSTRVEMTSAGHVKVVQL